MRHGWVYSSDCNKKEQLFIAHPRNSTVQNVFVSVQKNAQIGFMIVAGFCDNGKLKIKKFQLKSK